MQHHDQWRVGGKLFDFAPKLNKVGKEWSIDMEPAVWGAISYTSTARRFTDTESNPEMQHHDQCRVGGESFGFAPKLNKVGKEWSIDMEPASK
jgi:hypothetical protein